MRVLILTLVLLVGCGSEIDNNTSADAGIQADSGLPDTGPSDSGAEDAGVNPDNFVVEFELVSDDGVPHLPASPYGPDGGEPGAVIAVRHDPGAPALITGVRVPITGVGNPRAPFRIQLYEDTGDGPGAPMLEDAPLGELMVNHQLMIDILWASVSLPEPVFVDGPFFVGVEYIESQSTDALLFIGLDDDNTGSDGWVYNIAENSWTSIPDAFGLVATPGIRATIRVTESDALDREWRAGYSPTRCFTSTSGTLPFDENIGGWMSARIETPRTPFNVESIQYYLRDYTDVPTGFPPCSSAVAHRVELYLFDEDVPPSDPTPVASWDVPAHTDPINDTRKPFRHELTDPVRVEDGQYLYTAIQLQENPTGRTCLHACVNGANSEAFFWSNTPTPPHTWTVFSDYFPADFQYFIEATGTVE